MTKCECRWVGARRVKCALERLCDIYNFISHIPSSINTSFLTSCTVQHNLGPTQVLPRLEQSVAPPPNKGLKIYDLSAYLVQFHCKSD